MKHHVIIAAGGSGGHLLPAQVVAQELQKEGVTSTFAAFGLNENLFFERSAWPFYEILASPTSASVTFLLKASQGIAQAIRMFRKERPSLVIGFGSYHVFPVLAAAVILRIPIVLYAADAVPGRAIRLFAPFARWTGCFFGEAAATLRGTAYQVDFPLRQELRSPPSQTEGCSHFGFTYQYPTILVIGGSQGAKAVNAIVPKALSRLALTPTVIHLAGHASDIDGLCATYRTLAIKAFVHPFEHAMHYAFAAADIVIARSGACTIAEIEACCKPAIYIPYPRSMDDHQKKNASLAAARGRAVVIDEAEATPERVASSIEWLLDPCAQKCEYQGIYPPTFVAKILHTLNEVRPCQRR